MMLDIDSFEAPKSNGGKVVFIKNKYLPITFKPIGGLYPYASVFDAAIGRNRVPARGEKASTRYLINGLTPANEIKAFDCGVTVIEAIKTVRQTVAAMGLDPSVYVTITASGSGKDTEYNAVPAKIDKSFPQRDVAASELHDLASIAKSLVVESAGPSPAGSLTSKVLTADDDDLAFAK